MNAERTATDLKLSDRFRLFFKRHLADYQAQHGFAPEGFGVAWEKALEQAPVDEQAQAQLYRELIDWAKSELFALEENDALSVADINRVVPRDGSDWHHGLIQESRAEIRRLHRLKRRQRVLGGRFHQLTEDLRAVYGRTEKLWFASTQSL